MIEKEIRSWKKVFESDLTYIAYELKEMVQTPAMILLEGPLGSGKTTFSKVFIENGETYSPSYSILSETNLVLHADFYRVKGRDEVIHLELPLYLEDKQFFLVEWGKKHFSSICKELPDDYQTFVLEISINDEGQESEPSSRNFKLFEVFEH